MVCGVRPISGTITSACLPCASTFSSTLRYTSVLPEPVTPASSQAEKTIGGAVNRAHGGGLLGIQTQAIARDGKAVAPVVKGRCFTGQLAQPFLP